MSTQLITKNPILVDVPYHVVNRANNKCEIFHGHDDYMYFIEVLRRCSEKYKIQIPVFMLMYNHFHLIVIPRKNSSLPDCMRLSQLLYTFYHHKSYGGCGRLWQRRYYRAPIKTKLSYTTIENYIYHNPLRARLVKDVLDWKYSSQHYKI